MKLKPLTLIIASLFAANVAVAADEPDNAVTGQETTTAPAKKTAASNNDIAQWQSAQSSMPAQQQPAPVQPQPTPAANQPTTAIPAAPEAVQPQPQQQIPAQQNMTQVNPQTLETLPPPLAQTVQPITPGQVKTINKRLNQMSAATNYKFVTPVPRISSQTVSLSAGSSIPQIKVYPNVQTTVTFSDSTGHPWKLGAPPSNSTPCESGGTLCVLYIPGSAVFTVQPVSEYANGNITVMLQGLATPVMLNVKSLDPSSDAKTIDVDYRLDLRIPKRGPDTPVYTATPETKISLYDKQLQQFLDGIPPDEAQKVKLRNAPGGTRVWQIGDDLYVRSQLQLQDEFEKTLSAIDGTHVYVLPATPVLTFSENGRARDVDVELN